MSTDGLLGSALSRAWCRETSADPDAWSESNAAWGQCAVTALVVQSVFGGDLLRSTVRGISHYWNRLPDGRHVDLTIRQFGPTAFYDDGPVERDRDYVLSFPDTARRYALLLEGLR